MNTIYSVFLSILIVISASPVKSYENKQELVNNGVSGIWFDSPTADLILKDLTELSLIKSEKIPEFEKKVSLQEISIEKYKMKIEISDQIIGSYKVALSKSEENYAYLEKSYLNVIKVQDKWYKSPSFLYVIGVVSGGLLAVGISFGLKGK